MSFLQGVTNFLESVDQKAGEMAEARRRQADQGSSDDDGEGIHAATSVGATSTTTAAVRSPPLSQAQSGTLADHVSTNPMESAKLIQSLLAAQSQLTERHEKALAERHDAFSDLESRYHALQLYNQSLDEKVLKLTDEVEDANGRTRVLRQQNDALVSEATSRDESISTLRNEKEELSTELQQLMAERSGQAAELAMMTEGRRRAEASVDALQAEHAEYRRKVKRTMEEKERMIADLQAAHASGAQLGTDGELGATADSGASEEVASLRASLEAAAVLQRQLEAQVKALHDDVAMQRSAVHRVEGERDAALDARRGLQMEVEDAERLYDGERSSHADTRRAKQVLEEEVDTLRKSIQAAKRAQPQSAAAGQSEALELRIRELAEMLMEKQAALEAKRSEADQWRTRFEVSQQRLREAELVQSSVSSHGGGASANGSSAIGRGTRAVQMEDDGVSDLDITRNKFMKDLSRRGPWGQRVVSVAHGIDRVSLRTGSVLRRSAVIRVGMILYVVLLHVWVFFAVSLSSIPSDGRHDVGPKM